ncbi:MAG: Bax inhibitor-1/YccA family protein [Coprobacillus sp.]
MDASLQNTKISYQKFLSKIFKWMFIGLAITTLTSILLSFIGVKYLSEATFFMIVILVTIIEIVMVIILAKKLSDLSVQSAKKYFYIYSVINGVTISFLLSIIDPFISVLAFALTCALFGLLYAIATHTTYDFTSIGNMCLTSLPILILGYIILFFIQAPLLFYIVIFIDLALFVGITLYDIQQIEVMYNEATDSTVESFAMIGALNLYMDFINIFIDILLIIADGS